MERYRLQFRNNHAGRWLGKECQSVEIILKLYIRRTTLPYEQRDIRMGRIGLSLPIKTAL